MNENRKEAFMLEIYKDKMSVTKEQIDAAHERYQVNIRGITPELKKELEDRIQEFEAEHEWDALHGGNGWVKRIASWDIWVMIGLDVIFVIWWLMAIM